ncbi:hypothetical protein GIB67_018023 [Kingdonia uniflora]|uniref:DUF4283 domain-containing protein n=1 Tax=Kingdonia uniflora TaxID=39325 RepID=A0A7J7NWG1_9MAGN|nr:hypothetical protein GIB67_018023 [Kingdonia uniflora]
MESQKMIRNDSATKEFLFLQVTAYEGKVLEIGYIHIAGTLLSKPWRPYIESDEEDLSMISIWVKCRNMPIHYWDDAGIGKIASGVGIPLFMDKATQEKSRRGYVRVCVVVAERALFLWNNDHIVSLIAQNRNVILPIIFESLEKNIQSHWNQAVHGLTGNVRKMFLEMDTELFEECQRQFQEKESRAKDLEEQRELIWKRLEVEAEIASKSGAEDMIMVN